LKPERVSRKNNIAYLPGANAVPVRDRLIRAMILLLILYFVLLFASQYWRLVQFRRTLDTIEAEIRAVRAQNEEMLREIERLHTPAYLEEMAREELGMVRSGELLFLFREDNP
jgi:cell division protein DivIC